MKKLIIILLISFMNFFSIGILNISYADYNSTTKDQLLLKVNKLKKEKMKNNIFTSFVPPYFIKSPMIG